MLLFGHVGISLAAAGLYALIANRVNPEQDSDTTGSGGSSKSTPREEGKSWLRFGRRGLDYRLVVLGALLPDIIDKPIGVVFFGSEGRLIGHTLLFALVLTFVGLYLYGRHGRVGLLLVALCSMGHLILDEMWLEPETLFWPTYGEALAEYDVANWEAMRIWFDEMVQQLETNPVVLLPEILGIVVVAVLSLRFVAKGNLVPFRRNGKADQ